MSVCGVLFKVIGNPMTKYPKEDITEVYQAEILPILDDEDRIGEMSKDKREYISLFNDPEDYEDEIAEYDDYEPDDYADDVILDDVVYAVENAEIEITEEDLIIHQLKEKIRQCIPPASPAEINQIAHEFIEEYGLDNLPFEMLQQYIYGNIIRQMYGRKTFREKVTLFIKTYFQSIHHAIRSLVNICKYKAKKITDKILGRKFIDEYPKGYEESDFIYLDNCYVDTGERNYDEEWYRVKQRHSKQNKSNEEQNIDDIDIPF